MTSYYSGFFVWPINTSEEVSTYFDSGIVVAPVFYTVGIRRQKLLVTFPIESFAISACGGTIFRSLIGLFSFQRIKEDADMDVNFSSDGSLEMLTQSDSDCYYMVN